MDRERVAVLMSTYNGASTGFLRQQIDSILGQEGIDVRLYIRDDRSTDNTVEILREYAEQHSNITLIEGKENLGSCRSFLKLIGTEIDSEYFALSDQDDIWDPDKLAIAVKLLKTLPQDRPALYYSNQRVVDTDNNFVRTAHKEPQIAKNKYTFLADPLGAGCTCVYNRKLAEIAWETKPNDYSMHDTWVYNAAAMFGNIIYDFEPHMNYRQHASNVIGTPKKYMSLDGIKKQLHYYLDRESQPRWKCALIMEEQWKDRMNEEQSRMVSMIADYKKSLRNQMRLFRCREMYPGNRYRRLRWKTMILLRNI